MSVRQEETLRFIYLSVVPTDCRDSPQIARWNDFQGVSNAFQEMLKADSEQVRFKAISRLTSGRLNAVYKKNGIETLSQIFSIGVELHEMDGVGRVTAVEHKLVKKIFAPMLKRPLRCSIVSSSIQCGESRSLVDFLKKILALEQSNDTSEVEFEMFCQRYGLYDGISRILEDVAKYFDVSRERVRQRECRVIKRIFEAHRDIIEEFVSKVKAIIVEGGYVFNAKELAVNVNRIFNWENTTATGLLSVLKIALGSEKFMQPSSHESHDDKEKGMLWAYEFSSHCEDKFQLFVNYVLSDRCNEYTALAIEKALKGDKTGIVSRAELDFYARRFVDCPQASVRLCADRALSFNCRKRIAAAYLGRVSKSRVVLRRDFLMDELRLVGASGCTIDDLVAQAVRKRPELNIDRNTVRSFISNLNDEAHGDHVISLIRGGVGRERSIYVLASAIVRNECIHRVAEMAVKWLNEYFAARGIWMADVSVAYRKFQSELPHGLPPALFYDAIRNCGKEGLWLPRYPRIYSSKEKYDSAGEDTVWQQTREFFRQKGFSTAPLHDVAKFLHGVLGLDMRQVHVITRRFPRLSLGKGADISFDD